MSLHSYTANICSFDIERIARNRHVDTNAGPGPRRRGHRLPQDRRALEGRALRGRDDARLVALGHLCGTT